MNSNLMPSRAIDAVGRRLLAPPLGGAVRAYRHHGDRSARAICLTFDDGPTRGSSERVLDALGELGVPGTFFCVGANVAMNPDLAERMVSEGHSVGSHSQGHSRNATLSARDVAHIDDAERAILEATGRRPTLYRPPWGWMVPWEYRRLRSRGYTLVGWDVDGLDWMTPEPSPASVVEVIDANVQNGSIILLHDGIDLTAQSAKTVTALALRQVVPRLQAQGFEFVRVDQIFGLAA